MPWLCTCIGVFIGLLVQKLNGELSSWWLVMVPVPVYFGVQVLLGVAFSVYMSRIGRRW